MVVECKARHRLVNAPDRQKVFPRQRAHESSDV